MKYHKWSDIKRRRLSPARLRASATRVEAKLLEMSLAELRKGLGVTQEELAEAANTSQAELSKMERRTDRLVSTIRSYVEALGGKIEIIAVVGGERVRLHV